MAEAPLSEQVIVRAATDADAPVAARLCELAFSATTVGEGDPASGRGAEAAPVREPPPPLRVVAEHRGQVVAVADAVLRGQWFGGRRTLCAAVGPVAVGVEARGLGVGKALMSELLRAAHDAGATTSALVPSTHRFYRSLGFGIAGRRPIFAISTEQLRALAPARIAGLRLRPTRPGDAAEVAGLVSARAAAGTGLLDHAGADEQGVDDPSRGDSYVAEVDGVVRGWCLLGREPASTPHAHYDVVVHDLVAADPGVELTLWRLLVADHPSALRARAPLLPGGLLEDSLERQQDVLDDGTWMSRLLDVDAALTQRGYPAAVTATIHLSVHDPVCPWNAGTRRLSVTGGVATITPAPREAPDLVIDAADLASTYSGYTDPQQLVYRGRLTLAPGRASTLRALFAGPPAWLARSF